MIRYLIEACGWERLNQLALQGFSYAVETAKLALFQCSEMFARITAKFINLERAAS